MLISTVLRVHITVAEVLYKINYYHYFYEVSHNYVMSAISSESEPA